MRTLWPLGEHMFGVFRLLFWLTKKPSVFYSCPRRIWYVCGLRRRLGCWSFLSYLRKRRLEDGAYQDLLFPRDFLHLQLFTNDFHTCIFCDFSSL
jgi:hypothetical protein